MDRSVARPPVAGFQATGYGKAGFNEAGNNSWNFGCEEPLLRSGRYELVPRTRAARHGPKRFPAQTRVHGADPTLANASIQGVDLLRVCVCTRMRMHSGIETPVRVECGVTKTASG